MYLVIENILEAIGQVAIKWQVKVVPQETPLSWSDCIIAQCLDKQEANMIAEMTNTFNSRAKRNFLNRYKAI